MRRKLLFLTFFVAAIAAGYFFRGTFGREASIWIIVGLIGLVAVLKGVQLGLNRYVKVQEARMSPEERQKFEEYKRSVSGEGKAT